MDLVKTLDGSRQNLCLACQKMDARLASGTAYETIPDTGVHMLFLDKRSRRTDCRMCRFLLDFNPHYAEERTQHVRLFDRSPNSALQSTHGALTQVRKSRVLSVLHERSLLNRNDRLWKEFLKFGLLVYEPDIATSASPTLVRSIPTTTVDFAILRGAIGCCQKGHGLCAQTKHQYSLSYIYLIDCIEETVTRESPSQEYLTLSYVWGPRSRVRNLPTFGRKSPEGVFSLINTPLTVQDAIQVVRELGKRFL